MAKEYRFKKVFFAAAVGFVAHAFVAVEASALVPAPDPVRADSRIKTMVYNENEVYTIIAKNGFHTTLELDKSEKIETVSIGDAVGWQITPSKNRIFVKPLLKTGTTNLSVVTNKRQYQFELVTAAAVRSDDNVYVVKFFYPNQDQFNYNPQDRTRDAMRPVSETAIPVVPEFAPPAAFAPPAVPAFSPPPSPASSLPPLSGAGFGIEAFNYNYTLTGPEEYAPKKIYDDGASTFFEFANPPATPPSISAVMPDGSESLLSVNAANGKYSVSRIAAKFVIRSSGVEQICVFNENMSQGF